MGTDKIIRQLIRKKKEPKGIYVTRIKKKEEK